MRKFRYVLIITLLTNPPPKELSEKMYKEGYHFITNTDFSSELIEEMKERNSHLDEMDCK